ncbi:MAG TPA: alpha-ribazole phosphatase [Anaerolineae bacterium]|nr:alpha-ribazole phosphatase [Anaerolineae bacterium]
MNVYWVRHTRVDVRPGTCYGRLDVPLATTFEADVESILAHVPSGGLVFSSPLTRCQELAAVLGAGYEVDERLVEYDFGEWEGRPWAEIEGKAAEAWFNDFVHVAPPGGESFEQLVGRVQSFWDEVLLERAGKGGDVIVVTHVGVIRAALALATGMPLVGVFAFDVHYGSVTEIGFLGTHVQVRGVNKV